MQNNNFMNMNYFSDVLKNMDYSKLYDMYNQNMKMFQNFNPKQANFTKQFTDFQEQISSKYFDTMNKMISENPFLKLNQNTEHNENSYSYMSDFMSTCAQNIQLMTSGMQEMSHKMQAVVKKKAEMLSAQSSEINEMMKQLFTTSNPEMAMSLQADFLRKSFDNIVSDYQKLIEMSNSSTIEAFENMSHKITEGVSNFQKMMKCSMSNMQNSCSKSNSEAHKDSSEAHKEKKK